MQTVDGIWAEHTEHTDPTKHNWNHRQKRARTTAEHSWNIDGTVACRPIKDGTYPECIRQNKTGTIDGT